MFKKLTRLVREPLVHFLLIGGAIYALYGFNAGGYEGDNERSVTVTSGDIQSMADQWLGLWSRPPTDDELAGVIRDHVRTQILYREAVAMGLDNGDIVIERRLAQKVELVARSLITPEEPTDQVLSDWYAANTDRFRQPDLYTLTHVFFDPDIRDESTLEDARAVLDELISLTEMPASYGDYGDRFMLQNYYPSRSALELRKLFGSGFVQEILQLEPGIWHGPVLSGYGTHLVFLNDVTLAPQPALEDIRQAVKDEWMAAQVTELSERFLHNLVSRYEIIVEETEVPITVASKDSSP
jgi:hypothetical protein